MLEPPEEWDLEPAFAPAAGIIGVRFKIEDHASVDAAVDASVDETLGAVLFEQGCDLAARIRQLGLSWSRTENDDMLRRDENKDHKPSAVLRAIRKWKTQADAAKAFHIYHSAALLNAPQMRLPQPDANRGRLQFLEAVWDHFEKERTKVLEDPDHVAGSRAGKSAAKSCPACASVAKSSKKKHSFAHDCALRPVEKIEQAFLGRIPLDKMPAEMRSWLAKFLRRGDRDCLQENNLRLTKDNYSFSKKKLSPWDSSYA